MKKTYVLLCVVMVVILTLAAIAIAPLSAKAADLDWDRDVTNTTIGWETSEIVGIQDIYIGDPTISGTIASGTGSYEFTVLYRRWVESGHPIYDPLQLLIPGVPAHCPDGFFLGLDPANPTLCAQLVTPGTEGYYIYDPVIPAVDPIYGCPDGYIKGLDPTHPNDCAKQTNEGATHLECEEDTCPLVEFSDSREVCPTDVSAYTSHTWKPCGIKSGLFHWHYADKVAETYGPIAITYEKSCDPNKCHRPSDSELRDLFPGMPDWVRHDITSNKLNDGATHPGITPEWLSVIEGECVEVLDDPIFEYADEIIVIPGVPASCAEGFAFEIDPANPNMCAQYVPAVDTVYAYADIIPATEDIWGCPNPTYPVIDTEIGQCVGWEDTSGYEYMTLQFSYMFQKPVCVLGDCGDPRQELTPPGGVSFMDVTMLCIETEDGCQSEYGLVMKSYVPIYIADAAGGCTEVESFVNLYGQQIWHGIYEYIQPWMAEIPGFSPTWPLVRPEDLIFRADAACTIPLRNVYPANLIKDWGDSCSNWPEASTSIKVEGGSNYLFRGPLVNTSDLYLMLKQLFPDKDYTDFLAGLGNQTGWILLP